MKVKVTLKLFSKLYALPSNSASADKDYPDETTELL
jgi:hypothetical protein